MFVHGSIRLFVGVWQLRVDVRGRARAIVRVCEWAWALLFMECARVWLPRTSNLKCACVVRAWELVHASTDRALSCH